MSNCAANAYKIPLKLHLKMIEKMTENEWKIANFGDFEKNFLKKKGGNFTMISKHCPCKHIEKL